MTKAKDESYFTLDKYECYWEDAYMEIDWKNIDEAKLDTPQIACTEGFLIKKTKDYHTFVMTISKKEVGEQMIIPTKSIKKMIKLGRKTFYKKDFDYKRYLEKQNSILTHQNIVYCKRYVEHKMKIFKLENKVLELENK